MESVISIEKLKNELLTDTDKSMISLNTHSCPLFHVNPDYPELHQENEILFDENKLHQEKEMITFQINEFEDFYLQNISSPQFCEKRHNNFAFSRSHPMTATETKELDFQLFERPPSPESPDTPLLFSNKFIPFTSAKSYDNIYLNAMKQQKHFDSMSISQIVDLNFSITDLISKNLVIRFIKDSIGSVYLQKEIKNSTNNDTISELLNYFIGNNINLATLSKGSYSNYVIQLLFSYGNDLHHEILFNTFVYNSIGALSKSKCGSRVIQNILSVANKSKLISLIFNFSKKIGNKLHEYLFCLHANHIIQRMIELKLPFKILKFIADELENNLPLYCEHVYACRIVQGFIKHYGNKLKINKLFINNNHLYLSQLKYGNYVIQCIIKQNEWYSDLAEFNIFRDTLVDDVFTRNNILFLCKGKHSSNVVETCIKVANNKQIDYLINIICDMKAYLLKQILSDKFGNYVPKTLFENSNKIQQKTLANITRKYITNSYDNNGGQQKQYSKFIQMCQKV